MRKTLGRIDACYDYLTRYGKAFANVKACFQGASTYGEGKATFRSTDAEGYYMPGHSWDTKMSWEDFFNRMEKFKARRVSGLANPPSSPYDHKTEMPGIPGHHRLTGFNKRLAKAIGII